jgi:hypothetical protein
LVNISSFRSSWPALISSLISFQLA